MRKGSLDYTTCCAGAFRLRSQWNHCTTDRHAIRDATPLLHALPDRHSHTGCDEHSHADCYTGLSCPKDMALPVFRPKSIRSPG